MMAFTGHDTAKPLARFLHLAQVSFSQPIFPLSFHPAMVNLDARIASAIDGSLKYSNPRFDYHLHTRGLAVLLKTASVDRLHDYHAAGKIALQQHALGYFIQSEIPWACRETIKRRILSSNTFEYIASTANWQKPHFVEGTDVASDLIYIFLGALRALDPGASFWFRDTFGPMVDAAATAIQAHSRERLAQEKSNSSPDSPNGDTPTAKRARLSNTDRKILHVAKATEVLSTPSPLDLNDSELDETYLEEIEVTMMVDPASLVDSPAPPLVVLSPCAASYDTASSLFDTANWSSLMSVAPETICRLFTSVVALTRATFSEPASDGEDTVLHIPGAFKEGMVKTIKPITVVGRDEPAPPPASGATYPSPPFRRSRAPSPPSPPGPPPSTSLSIAQEAIPATSNQARPAPTFRRSRAPSPPSPPDVRPRSKKTGIPATSPTLNLPARTLGPTTSGHPSLPPKAMLLNMRTPSIIYRKYPVPPSSPGTSLSDRFRADYQPASFF
ncbi:hypothetical protein C8R47DRAFT_1095254 [Mycena vitilis]|nr:hypothetical protein C8R47DRAFT_1095254 [Mycena vitilis]